MRIPIAKETIINAITPFAKRHPLITFFVIAYLFTWLGWLVPEWIDRSMSLGWVAALITFPLMAGPLLVAPIVGALTDGKAGVMALLRKFTIWRVGLVCRCPAARTGAWSDGGLRQCVVRCARPYGYIACLLDQRADDLCHLPGSSA